jgi:hypothetical protein
MAMVARTLRPAAGGSVYPEILAAEQVAECLEDVAFLFRIDAEVIRAPLAANEFVGTDTVESEVVEHLTAASFGADPAAKK